MIQIIHCFASSSPSCPSSSSLVVCIQLAREATLAPQRLRSPISVHTCPQGASEVMSTFYELSAKKLDGSEFKFSDLKGKIVLVENTATLWGTTVRDFTQMNELCEKYGDKLVSISLFLCISEINAIFDDIHSFL